MYLNWKAAVVIICALTRYTWAHDFVVIDLGALCPNGGSVAHAINRAGRVVGGAFAAPNCAEGHYVHGFLWDSTAGMRLLSSSAPEGISSASGINANDQAVGYALIGGVNRAVFWEAGQMVELPALGESGGAGGINDLGQAVGVGRLPDGRDHAAWWPNVSQVVDLGTLTGDLHSVAVDINTEGRIVGHSWNATNVYRAFLWQAGAFTDLGLPVGSVAGFARAISDAGQVAGEATVPAGGGLAYRKAVVWQQNGSTAAWESAYLASLGGPISRAYDVNNVGQIVGNAQPLGESAVAVLWEQGTVKNLNDLIAPSSGWFLEHASAINDAQEIVGYGMGPDTIRRAFLLAPADCDDNGVPDRCERFGDVNRDCTIDIDDLVFVLDAFVHCSVCPDADLFPCGGDGLIDVDDIFAALAAFVGTALCPGPCE